MKKNKKFAIISLVLIGLIFATFVISLNMGSSSLTPMDIIKTLVGLGTKNQEIVIFRLRLPRILMALLIGIALAIAGTILQGVTKNDLADAGILGINSGAALFVVMYIYFLNGNVYDVTVEETTGNEAATATHPVSNAGSVEIKSSVPGKIIAVEVSQGQAVKAGDTVVILESMKMESPVVAPQDGTIASIAVSQGNNVENGAVLATMN